MKEWKFDELYEYIEEVFNKSLKDKLNALQAGGRCLYEFANVIEDGETEKKVIYTTIATLQIKQGVISHRIFEEVLNIIETFDVTVMNEELDLDEISKFTKLIENLKIDIDIRTVEIS